MWLAGAMARWPIQGGYVREGTEIGTDWWEERMGLEEEGGRCREKRDLEMKLEFGDGEMARWQDGEREMEKWRDEEMRRRGDDEDGWEDERKKRLCGEIGGSPQAGIFSGDGCYLGTPLGLLRARGSLESRRLLGVTGGQLWGTIEDLIAR
ncbi:hypothetical protein RJ035_005404 [Blastomyces gilchristii]